MAELPSKSQPELATDPAGQKDDYNVPKEWNNHLNEVGSLEDYRFCNFKTLTFSSILAGHVIKLAQNWRLGKGGLFWDSGYIMTRLLLDQLESGNGLTEPKVLVELGAATMLPSLTAGFRYPEHLTCYATDLKKIVALTEQCHSLNGRPSNVVPMELEWGVREHYERLASVLDGKPIDFIVAADPYHCED